MAKTVRDVMMPEPWTIDARTSLEETAHQMRAWAVREVLVTHHGALCGMLNDHDMIVLAIASGHAPSQLSAGACCNPEMHRLDADQPIDDALDYMRHHELRRLPVVDGDQLVGSAWIADLAIASAELTNV
jgi:CBS domain-containing protein